MRAARMLAGAWRAAAAVVAVGVVLGLEASPAPPATAEAFVDIIFSLSGAHIEDAGQPSTSQAVDGLQRLAPLVCC